MKIMIANLGLLGALMLSNPLVLAASKTITWRGCGISKKAFMKEAAKKYEELYGIKIDLQGGGATKGIRTVKADLADMGGSCRHTFPQAFEKLESGLVQTVVAWDIIVPVAHPDNPLDSITTDQIKNIITGNIHKWEQLKPGLKGSINLHARRGEISGVGWSLREMFFDKKESDLSNNTAKIDISKKAKIQKSTGPVEKFTEKDPLAFGISGISSARKRKLKILKINGHQASIENVLAGKIPTFRPLYVVTKGPPKGEVAKFINWLLADEGQALIESQGTISVRQGAKAGLGKLYKYWGDTKLVLNFGSL